jgi:hypothetical protein
MRKAAGETIKGGTREGESIEIEKITARNKESASGIVAGG